VLSGGASGTWYFEWFQSNYPSAIERHIGVEAFAPKPDDLPSEVDWVSGSLQDLQPVATGSVDLAFGGQVLEHLWPDEVVGFLIAAHRVLRQGGHIALDSPNRRVTQSIGWLHPEHTAEFTVDEIVELLGLAGFDDIRVRGVLVAYDTERHRYLSLEELAAERGRIERAEGAASRPEDSFVWWAEAKRGKRAPDESALRCRACELFASFRAYRLSHAMSCAGDVAVTPYAGRIVRSARGHAGVILFGPYIPVPPGKWSASFDVAAVDVSKQSRHARVATLEVAHAHSRIAAREITADELDGDRRWSHHDVSFGVDETTMGVEFRVVSEGSVDLLARASVDLQPAEPIRLPKQRSARQCVRQRLSRLLAR
jgi:Methyltransferase domain